MQYHDRAKKRGYQKITVIEALHLSTKIQGVISNVVITEKNEKQYVRLQLGIPGTQVHL